MGRLGMRKRYLPARLAISRSLAIPDQPEPLVKDHEPGKSIKGDTLFGTGTTLSVWLALIVERSGQTDSDIKKLIAVVGAHWCRGLELLDREWEQSGQDVSKFVERLVDAAGLPTSGGKGISAAGGVGGATVSNGEIRVPMGEIGEDLATKETVYWSLNGKGGSPHSAIMGGSGSGKTVMAAAMLRAIRDHAPVPLLAFDFKGDLAGFTGTKGQPPLGEAFEAQVIEPPRKPIPLDVLSLAQRDQIGIDESALRFRDSFSRLKGSKLGDKQRNYVHEAVSRALSTEEPCELHHIRDRLNEVYQEREAKRTEQLPTWKSFAASHSSNPPFHQLNSSRRAGSSSCHPTCLKIAERLWSICYWMRWISTSTGLSMPISAPMEREACASFA